MSETETDDDGPEPRNEIVLRNYERQQLLEYLPAIIDLYEDRHLDKDDRNLVQRFTEIHDELQEPVDDREVAYDFGVDNWRDLSIALDELEETRASWLRTKIGRRAELPVTHMGFTTTVPFMSMMVGETPVRPD